MACCCTRVGDVKFSSASQMTARSVNSGYICLVTLRVMIQGALTHPGKLSIRRLPYLPDGQPGSLGGQGPRTCQLSLAQNSRCLQRPGLCV